MTKTPASLRSDPGALLHNGGRFVSESLADFSGIRKLGRRAVIGRFDGGAISSDGGGLLLREVDKRTGISERLARCFRDYRKQERIEHRAIDDPPAYLWDRARLRGSQ